jgi:hypothetical protein
MNQKNLYLVKNLEQLYSFLLIKFCLYFETDEIYIEGSLTSVLTLHILQSEYKTFNINKKTLHESTILMKIQYKTFYMKNLFIVE